MKYNQKASDEDLIEALKTYGSINGAARALGLHRKSISDRLPGLARKGFSPEHGLKVPYPDGFKMGKVTIHRNAGGEIVNTWERMNEDHERQRELMIAGIEAMVKDLPRVKARKATGKYSDDCMTGYPIGDPHIGMLSWAPETGKDWDLKIAEKVHCEAMKSLVASVPATRHGLIVNLGDLFHYDGMIPVTARSGHQLDSDGRAAKMIDVGVLIMRQCIESALDKHEIVDVICAPGNHDEFGARWLSTCLRNIYENEPRIRVQANPSLFAYHRFGKNLIGVHHGHTVKPPQLPGVMAADQAKAWGETLHRYWWMGHVHHESMKEFPGCSVESFNTLASNDAFAANGGWRSRENLQAIILHKEHGEVARSRVNAAMFR